MKLQAAAKLVIIYVLTRPNFIVFVFCQLTELVCPVLAQTVAYEELPEYIRPRLCRAIQESIVSERSVAAVLATTTCVMGLSELMAQYARDLVSRLAELPSSPRMAITILELLSESCGQPTFFRFFQEKQFRCVFDVLAPYTSVDQFTTFIVAIAYRLIFRWYLVVPVQWRVSIARYILMQVDAQKPPSSAASETNMAQVERKLSMQATSNSSLTSQNVKSLKTLREDARMTLVAFLRHFLFTNEPTASFVKSDPFAGCPEDAIRIGHWLVGDTIVTVRTVAFDIPQEADASLGGDDQLSSLERDLSLASANTTISAAAAAVDPDSSIDSPRRRHQSAVQHRVSKSVATPPTIAMDDSYISNNSQTNSVDRPQRGTRGVQFESREVASPPSTDGYTEVTIRHAFGKSSWLLRCEMGASSLPADFYADLLRPELKTPSPSLPLSVADEFTRSTTSGGGGGGGGPTMTPASQPLNSADQGDVFADGPTQLETRRSSFGASGTGGELRLQRAMTISVTTPGNRKSDMDLPTPDSAASSSIVQSSLSPDAASEQSAARAGVPEPAWAFLQLCQGGTLPCDQVVRIPAAKASQFARTLRTIDLIGHLETHTVGVVYAAPGQKTEAEMLANQYGSERYARFLRHLGDIVPIGGDSSPGGLSERDGHFTYAFDDPVTQVRAPYSTFSSHTRDIIMCRP